MPDPTPERVREIAGGDSVDISTFAQSRDSRGPLRAVSVEATALARQVIALREIAEEAANAWHAAQHGMENGPCLCPSHKVARARLDALAPVDGSR
jgi:hypothetical protein